MASDIEPIEGNWYYDRDKGRRFEVIAVDETEKRIDLQDFEGDLDEITFEDWQLLDLEAAEPPEEWMGPMDAADEDDLGDDDSSLSAAHGPNAMDRYRREQVEWAGKAHEPDPARGERRRQPRSSR
jgi:hypothetical protein